jgi:hypothetical protein
MNIKTLGIILCSAFSVGLVAETAFSVWSLVNGQGVSLHTSIELIIAWLVTLVVFIASIVNGFCGGSVRWVGLAVHHTVPSDDDDDEHDDEDTDEYNKEDCTDPESFPEQGTPAEQDTPEPNKNEN